MTSSAPNDLPLWKVTSGRSLIVHTVASALGCHSRARPGLRDRSELTSVSGSYRFWMQPSSIGVTPISGLTVSAVPPPTKPRLSWPPRLIAPAVVVGVEDEADEPLPQAAATSGDNPSMAPAV